MLSIAAGIVESHGLKRVMIANQAGDHTIYPDCRAEFIDAMSKAIHNGTYDGLDIVAPYTNISKTDIASIDKGDWCGLLQDIFLLQRR